MDTMDELKNEIRLLRTRCQYLENEKQHKDNEICELKKAQTNLQDMKRSASVHSFHPTMDLDRLPEEFEAVKKGLKETVEKCSELLSHLDIFTQARTPEVQSRDFQTQTSITDDLGGHATGLRDVVNDLNRRLDNWRESHIFCTQSVQHETFQDVVVRFQEAQNRVDYLVGENTKLNQHNEELSRMIENLTAVHATADAEAKENIQVLKQQTLAYREDFQSERRDREAAQNRVAELEAQVTTLQRVIRDYESDQMQEICRRRDEAIKKYREEHHRMSQNLYQTDITAEEPRHVGVDTCDSSSMETKAMAVGKISSK